MQRPEPLAWARVAIAILILLRTTPLLAPLHVDFLADASPLLGFPRGGLSLAWLPGPIVAALCVVRTVAALGLLLGVFAAPCGVVVAFAGYLVAYQSPFGPPATLQLLYEAAALLGLTDATTRLAVVPTKVRSLESSYWLIRGFVVSVYVWAGLFKLRPDWLDGRTLAVLRDAGAFHGNLAALLLQTPTTRAVVACSVAALELSVGPLLLWPRSRSAALVAAYAFHIGLQLTAEPDALGWGMMALLLSFLR